MKKGLFVLLALAVCIGCRSRGETQNPVESTDPEVPAPTVRAQPQNRGPAWRDALRYAGFNQGQDAQGSAAANAPGLMAKMSEFVNTVVARANDLHPQDPPEVTQRKAKALMDALRPYEHLRDAGIKVGMLNPATAQHLDGLVGQLRMETSKLLQFTPNPQMIAGVKRLANMLGAASGGATQWMQRGADTLQAFRAR